MTDNAIVIGLPRLHHLALTAWHRTLATTTDPYTRGKAEGRVIGLALALDQLQSDTKPKGPMMTDLTDEQRARALERPTANELILCAFRERPDWFAKRVLARLDGYPNSEACWVWQGYTRHGYGVTRTPRLSGRRTVIVHRVVWLALRGALTDGLVLDHAGPNGCNNRACANPDHLQEVTEYVNLVVTGAGACADHARRTHCPQGHPLEGDNLNRSHARRGWRSCRTCTRERGEVFMRAARSLGMSRRQYFAEHGYSLGSAKSLLAARGYLDRAAITGGGQS